MTEYKLKDLCLIEITDGTHKTPIYSEQGYMFLSSKNVTSGRIDWENPMYIPEWLHQELYKRIAPKKDDILLAKNGTTGIAAIVDRDEIFDIYVSLALIRPDKEKVLPKYLLYAINSDFSKKHFDSHLKGIGVPNLHLTHIRETPIKVPSKNTQEEIVAILDRLSDLIELYNQQLSKLDELVKSRFIELFENDEYEKVTVHSVLDTAFWLMPATPEFIADGEVPYITSKNIKNRMIDFDNVKYISKESYKSISSNRPTQKGDILVSMIGTLGQTAVIQDDREFYGQNLYLLRLNNAIVNTTFFCEFFNSDTAQHELQGKRNQSTQAYLKANHVEELILSLPPLELQKQFAAFVEQTDKLKLEIKKSLEKLETLKKSLMQKYFQ